MQQHNVIISEQSRAEQSRAEQSRAEQSRAEQSRRHRDSNLELYRILLMLGIIAHHYVVNSGLMPLFDYEHVTGNMVFLLLFGWGGKCIIDCFLLITGYFMCQQEFKLAKWFRLYFQVKFYSWVIAAIFLVTGYELLTAKGLFKYIFDVGYGMNGGFTAAFLGLYLITPFLNILIKHMSRRQHLLLIGTLTLLYTVTGSFLYNHHFEYLPWYSNMYLIGSYLRLYPSKWMLDWHCTARLTVLNLGMALLSVLGMLIVGMVFGKTQPYFWVNDSQKILALSTAVVSFLLFRHLPMGYHPLINQLAKSTLAVLLIHASSDTMRHWLWQDICKNPQMYTSYWLPVHAIVCVVVIWCVCTTIDQLRLKYLEPLIGHWIESRLVPWCYALRDRCMAILGVNA